jgi:exopolysaccharide biosynthesis polyprenyl glycosylphosphotransferase
MTVATGWAAAPPRLGSDGKFQVPANSLPDSQVPVNQTQTLPSGDYSCGPHPAVAPSRGARTRLLGRLLGRPVQPELVGLRVVELLFCGLLAYHVLAVGGGWLSPGRFEPAAGAQAAALVLTGGLIAMSVWIYRPGVYGRARALLLNTTTGVILGFPALWLAGQLAGFDLLALSEQGARRAEQGLLGATLLLFALRVGYGWALRAGLFVRRVLIIGPQETADRLAATIRALHGGFYEVARVLPAIGPAALPELARSRRAPSGRRLWGVVLVGEAASMRPLLDARAEGLRCYSEAAFWEQRLRRVAPAKTAQPGAGPCAGARRLLLQRPFDITLSLALLLLTLPLMLLTALAIRLDSPGPLLYRQERLGLGGEVFTLLKFRSMRTDAEAAGPVWAAQRDARVTRVGRFIRLVRIDELPQLLNILSGEMSFIGPRPERPHFVAQLERELPGYAERALVKPGLTGWAQVNYPYGASVEDARVKLSYDLYYVRNRSLWLDLLILLATVRVVLFQRGAR